MAWLRADLVYLLATRASRTRGGVTDGCEACDGEPAVVLTPPSPGAGAAAGGNVGGAGAAAEAEGEAVTIPPAFPISAWVGLTHAAVTGQVAVAGPSTGHVSVAGSSTQPIRKPTAEQRVVVDLEILWGTPQRIRLVAYAGTGKTFTLAKLASKHAGRRILYMVWITALR